MPGRLLSLLSLLTLLPGCSGFDVVNALVPSDGYQVIPDLPYDGGPRHKLDLYVPDDAKDGAPLLVFFYGGAWATGARSDYRFVGEAFALPGQRDPLVQCRLVIADNVGLEAAMVVLGRRRSRVLLGRYGRGAGVLRARCARREQDDDEDCEQVFHAGEPTTVYSR